MPRWGPVPLWLAQLPTLPPWAWVVGGVLGVFALGLMVQAEGEGETTPSEPKKTPGKTPGELVPLRPRHVRRLTRGP